MRSLSLASAAALALSLVCACSKPAAPRSVAETPTPSQAAAETSPSSVPPPPTTDEPVPAPQPALVIPQPGPSPDARTLEQRYFAAADAAGRAEIAGQICDLKTPEAAAAVRRLFSAENDENVKLALLTELAEMKAPAEREQNFGVFIAAVFPSQPRTIRETAISLLSDFGDARAVEVLRNLTNDPDSKIREAAADAVRELQKAN